MSEEYLWNRTGEPDGEIERLEKLLVPLAYCPPAKSQRWRWFVPVAAAAALVVIALVWMQPVKTDWTVSLADAEPRSLKKGEVIETSVGITASVRSDSVGYLTLAPQSRIKLTDASTGRQQFSLDHGLIRAVIWAPPANFAINTPSARAVDLGCQYTLRVDPEGDGLLAVEYGWVAFESQGIESFIPTGAECRTNRKTGPGVPYFADSSEELKHAVSVFEKDASAVVNILQAATARDGLTLWHLLERTKGSERDQVYVRLAQLVKLSPAANATAVRRGDRNALDAAWADLGLGETAWWRTWKRDW